MQPVRIDRSLIEGVLIATYFHDLGLVQSSREDHGFLGRKMCEGFFVESNHPLPSRFEEILDAVEFHDNKEVNDHTDYSGNISPDILTILSMADDLEAMGIIGIYRYIEIYLMRGFGHRELGLRVLGNSWTRFRNLLLNQWMCPDLMGRYSKQYKILVQFFENYNQQLITESHPPGVFHGHLGIVNYIRSLCIEREIQPGMIPEQLTDIRKESTVSIFFTDLKNELEKARL
jgi:hypothetical protein